MRYLMIALLFLSACAHAKKSTKVKELVLLEATEKTSTSGKEKLDGKSRSTAFSFIFDKPEEVKFNSVWINQNAYTFEEFEHEGKYYLVVQVFAGNRDNVLVDKLPIDSRAKAVIQYQVNEEIVYIEVDEFNVKDSVIGQ